VLNQSSAIFQIVFFLVLVCVFDSQARKCPHGVVNRAVHGCCDCGVRIVLIGSWIILHDISTKSIVTLLTEDRDPPFISAGTLPNETGVVVEVGVLAAG
jgi:hypothetical protein